jgi:N5-(cytidine 5'-diphosphoramidyl)-L-glutamine hydrolase
MKKIGVSLRVDTHEYKSGIERRDACDQRWFTFFEKCNVIPVLLPNHLSTVRYILDNIPLDGILLTGGNTPHLYGGDAAERDKVEAALIEWAMVNTLPLIGVCRGMQSIQMYFEQTLQPVKGQVCDSLEITLNGQLKTVNSYHTLGNFETTHPLSTWATAANGLVKAISHDSENIHGIMWHPERNSPLDEDDICFFKKVFKV